MSCAKNHQNYCKIVATLGNIEGREDIIEKLMLAGASVFRMNLSHDSVEGHSAKIKIIRDLEAKYKRPLGVLFDLQGPKLRVGIFKNNRVILKEGQKFRLDLDAAAGDETRVCLPHPEIYAAVQPGHALLFNDGLIRVRVDGVSASAMETTVLTGGELSNHKGVNVPDVSLPISALTPRDIENIKKADGLDIDWFALSFVQKPEDLQLARSLIKSKAGIIAKIEKPHAVDHLEEIIKLADVIMVARGDLGVELSPERVPVLQRKIVSACRGAGRPVIVATQMLESMINNATPTRAEASDVATAVYEGADAVMLSAETATGRYPVEAVRTMSSIISNVELDSEFEEYMRASHYEPQATDIPDAITAAAKVAASRVDTANFVVTFTDSGTTTLRAARQRPCVPILSLTPHCEVARKMSVVWGVQAHVVKDLKKFDDIEENIRVVLGGAAEKGTQVVAVAGIPFGRTGDTNLMYVITL
ncbi:MAG: pyruvate kinase [Elusimicrobiota bacterium]|jgi:pyruvate kinase|nr:pyruvate kinase [Elusimicrobiota bacterium]